MPNHFSGNDDGRAALEALYHLGPLSQRQLADRILRSSGNLTVMIGHLAWDGEVSRERHPADRRAFRMSLTDEGRGLIERLPSDHVSGIRGLFSVLEPDELRQLSALTRELGLEARRRSAGRAKGSSGKEKTD